MLEISKTQELIYTVTHYNNIIMNHSSAQLSPKTQKT